MNSTESLISAQHISYRLGKKSILEHIDVAIHTGELVTFIGPNGAGKTTLVRILLGILKPTEGEVVRVPNLSIGYVPQRIQINPYLPLTVKRFMTLGNPANTSDITQALEEIEAVHLLNTQMHDLSGGEWQRVLLARAIVRKPQLLILDEPAQGMDIGGQALFYDHVSTIKEKLGCGILMVSHDLHMVMANTDRVICIHRHVCCEGKPDSVREDPAFTDLFGEKAADVLALYSHKHDHTHGWNKSEKCDHD